MTGKICGTGSWVPDKVWDNNDLARMVETSDAWIRERTGVVQRHIAKENEDTVTMAARAAQKALEDAGMKAEEIDLWRRPSAPEYGDHLQPRLFG